MTTNPANEREATLGEYRYLCIRALGCTTHDTHSNACHRANDVARNEHYVGELEASIAETLPPLTIGQVWTDADLAAFGSLPGVFVIGLDDATDATACEVCGEPVDSGDEPGKLQSNGRWIDVCSVACTQAVIDSDVQHAGSLGECGGACWDER